MRIKSIKKFNKTDLLSLLFVLLFSIFFVFIFLKDSFFGRFSIIEWMLGNIFIKEIFNNTLLADPRTYSMVIYSILQEIFHIKITAITLLIVNKIFSVFLLIVIFLISKMVFKKNWISLIVLITFVSSIFIQKNLSSIEYGLISIFFTYTSILFLFKFMKDNNLTSFIISNICLVLSAYYRYELAFLFGLPYIAYYSIFVRKNKQTNAYMTFTIIILILSLMPLVNTFTHQEQEIMLGKDLEDKYKENRKKKNKQ